MAQPSAPRIYGSLLKPGLRVASVLEIDLAHLRESGVRGFIFDLDDTLVHALSPTAEQDVVDWITRIRDEFKLFIVSNNTSHNRVLLAAEHLGLPCVARAAKPSRRFFRHAMAEMGLQPHEVAIVGDQLFTDVLGGNRVGALSVLVDPLSSERKWHRKVMRSVETYMLRRTAYHQPLLSPHHASMGPAGAHHTSQSGDLPHPHRPSMGS